MHSVEDSFNVNAFFVPTGLSKMLGLMNIESLISLVDSLKAWESHIKVGLSLPYLPYCLQSSRYQFYSYFICAPTMHCFSIQIQKFGFGEKSKSV